MGFGFSPFAPGTVGTLLGIPAALAINSLPPWCAALILAAIIPVSAILCGKAAENGDAEDPGWIVLDEIVGYCHAAAFLQPNPTALATAFLLFRLFDILKPPPIGWIDRNIRGGWGIVLDDAAAGVSARLCLLILSCFWRF